MAQPPSIGDKLRIKFRNALRKGYVTNVELDPVPSDSLGREAHAGEVFIVQIDARVACSYWLSDRRVLQETRDGVRELFLYEAVQETHWMFHDLYNRLTVLQSEDAATHMKSAHFDRLEIETAGGIVVVEGLDQAYLPTLGFLQWLRRNSQADTAK
jgi:hypothetical protein